LSYNIKNILNHSSRLLRVAGIPKPLFEARLLLLHVTGITIQTQIGYPEKLVAKNDFIKLNNLLQRRCNYEPFAYIVGKKSFLEIEVAVNKYTLIPRPDSEVTVNSLKNIIKDNKPKTILDLGTGSGVLLLSLLKSLPESYGIGVDISLPALYLAKNNAIKLNLQHRSNFICSNWADSLNKKKFDAVIANPPYIPSKEINKLSKEIAHYEPNKALDGGTDGMEKFLPLLKGIRNVAKEGATICIEIGQYQELKVSSFMDSVGIGNIKTNFDLNNKPRCLTGTFF